MDADSGPVPLRGIALREAGSGRELDLAALEGPTLLVLIRHRH